MAETLEGQVAWVTGAGSGIGKASALALARSGARVVLSGRREANLNETAAAIDSAGGKALVVVTDMGAAHSVEACAAVMLEQLGRCDILVNCAGINIPKRDWSVVELAGFDEVIRTNLNGCFYASRAVLPIMRAQGGGLLIQVSSWAGLYVVADMGPAYVAAKHGLVAMSENLNQQECVNGIRSCCLCPAEVATPILDKRLVPVSSEDRARMLQPEDLAELVLFIARAPKTVCFNEILLSPTWNRAYIG